MLIGFILTFSITEKAWQRFQLNPAFTSLLLNDREMQMVYPTISVCPENSADERKVSELVEKLGMNLNDSKEIQEFFRAIPNFSFGMEGLRAVVLSDAGKKIVDRLPFSDVRELAFKLTLSCRDVFKNDCKFKNGKFDCCDAFFPVYGEHGFCYAFNPKVYGTAEKE